MVLVSKQNTYKKVFVEFYWEWIKTDSVKIMHLLILVKKKISLHSFFFTVQVLWDTV